MPLHVRPAGVRFLAVRAFELPLHLMDLPVLGTGEQRLEALAALLADVATGANVRLPVLQQLGVGGEASAADGADPRQLALLRVGLLMMRGQRPQVTVGAAAQLAGKGNRRVVMFALVLCQIPGVLKGSVTLRAAKRSLSGVRELVPSHVGRPSKLLPTCFARQRSQSAVTLGIAGVAPGKRSLSISFREKLDGRKYFIGAGGRRCEFLPCETPVYLRVNGLHVEVRRAGIIRDVEGTL